MDISASSGKRASRQRDSSKRLKVDNDPELFNFIRASMKVLQQSRSNTLEHLKLLVEPSCFICTSKQEKLVAMSDLVALKFENEMNLNTWYDALETCHYWITPTQYLPGKVLRGIVEIMLNAHADVTSPYSIQHIINKCQQVLSLHFNMHPPCRAHVEIINCYTDFLTETQTDYKTHKHSTKIPGKFEYTKGIAVYCFNRLIDEICHDNNFCEDIENMYVKKYGTVKKETLHKFHWEEQNFEIYNRLDRCERINRLIAVLDSIIELIQMDVYYSTHSVSATHQDTSGETPVQRREKRHNYFQSFYTKLNETKIMQLFAYFVHLDCPEEHVRVLSLWLNTLLQKINLSSDCSHPSLHIPIKKFANEFYKILQNDIPHQSIIKILGKIEPPWIRHLICLEHCFKVLNTEYGNVIKIVIDFIESSNFSEIDQEFIVQKNEKQNVQENEILSHLSQLCKNIVYTCDMLEETYPKYKETSQTRAITLQEKIQVLYISLDALLESYYVQKVHNAIKNNEIQDELSHSTTGNRDGELEKVLHDIYFNQKELINILGSSNIPKCLECFKIIFV